MNSVLDTLEKLIGKPIARNYTTQQVGDARDTAADIARARRAFGFEPDCEFEAGLRAQLEWQTAAVAAARAVS